MNNDDIKIYKDETANDTYTLIADKEYTYTPYNKTHKERVASCALRAFGLAFESLSKDMKPHKIVMYHAKPFNKQTSEKVMVFIDEQFKLFYSVEGPDYNCLTGGDLLGISSDIIEMLWQAGKISITYDKIFETVKTLYGIGKLILLNPDNRHLFKDIVFKEE